MSGLGAELLESSCAISTSRRGTIVKDTAPWCCRGVRYQATVRAGSARAAKGPAGAAVLTALRYGTHAVADSDQPRLYLLRLPLHVGLPRPSSSAVLSCSMAPSCS